jgi:hypothetical protein
MDVRYPLGEDLGPGAWCCAEVDNSSYVFEEVEFFVELEEFECGSSSITLFFRQTIVYISLLSATSTGSYLILARFTHVEEVTKVQPTLLKFADWFKPLPTFPR